MNERTLTCVYCGMEYPQGTPASGAKILTDHIKICQAHPMFKLKTALEKLIGASSKEELEAMKTELNRLPISENDRLNMIYAIDTLLELI